MIKKIFIAIILIVVLYSFYNPIVIQLQEKSTDEFTFSENETFSLKKLVKGEDKKYKAYIVLNFEELEYLSPEINKSKVLVSNDSNLIRELLNCKFKYTGSDASTIESKIYIYSDNDLVFESEISLNSNSQGLQNRQFGWVKPVQANEFIDICSKFNRYYLPILIIH